MNGNNEYDVVVVGAGPAGYPAAVRAARLGASVAVVEEKWLGGTCLNVGCIPTKYLCKRTAANDPRPWPALLAEKDLLVADLVKGIDFLFKKRGIAVFEGKGDITREGNVVVRGKEDITLKARKGVLYAPGSRAARVPALPVDHDVVVESDDLMYDGRPFSRLVVVGGGAIGLEWATIFRRRGVGVTVIEMMPQVLPGLDSDVAKRLASSLRRGGVEVLTGVKVEGVRRGDGECDVLLDDGRAVSADRVLVAVGRAANVDPTALTAVGIEVGRRIVVDERMRTSRPGIWAAGDGAGEAPMLAHVATRQGIIAVEDMLGHAARWRDDRTPWAVFTEPEAAGVGLNTAQAAAAGIAAREGRADYRALGRPRADGHTEGFVKILAADDGRLLGAHALGYNAAEIVQVVSAAMACDGTIAALGEFVAIHPTYAELIAEAIEDWRGLATHKP